MQSYSGVGGKVVMAQIFSPFQGNQQARQMDDDALAIKQNKPVLVPGEEEGLKDIRIVEAIFRIKHSGGKRISL